jgi:pyruvate dehydrogenase E1 component
LCGELGRENGHAHLRETLGINGALHLRAAGQQDGAPLGPGDAVDLAGRRIPVVSVHDGEVGLLDNIGSLVGVRQIARAVVKFSKSGTPRDVYRYHHLDPASIAETCGEALAETALERVQLHADAMPVLQRQQDERKPGWKELWPDPV